MGGQKELGVWPLQYFRERPQRDSSTRRQDLFPSTLGAAAAGCGGRAPSDPPDAPEQICSGANEAWPGGRFLESLTHMCFSATPFSLRSISQLENEQVSCGDL